MGSRLMRAQTCHKSGLWAAVGRLGDEKPGRDFPELRLREHQGTYRAEGGAMSRVVGRSS